ncbi:hypothetical protein I8752_21095 [Nostocaceae cyanobacterium CENA369]|uniref:Uncharacterized protein n=1 Tax=Dendronalium phyllosphericum CENA369 TaxID=1725256 RepID=A0A8J7I400_9NOST|nr:hypothetical protein [Dendronalium phyllosphericum]MBH8575460.1 hypothetical protein [Dendronalium phyllosphericum CENA369]
MAEPTLTDVFGTGTTQDGTSLTILKANLPGLTASSSNTPESLLTGILLKAQTALTSDNRDANIDQSLSIETTTTPSFTSRNDTVYIRDTITIELDRPAGNLAIDPDNY